MNKLFLLLLLIISASTKVYAQPRSQFTGIDSLKDASQALDSKKLVGPGTIEITYFGEELPAEYEEILVKAAARGFQVKGTLIRQEDFEEQFLKLSQATSDGIQETLVQLPESEEKKRELIEYLSPRNQFDRLRKTIRKFFGTPYGIVIFPHFKNLFRPKKLGTSLYLSLEATAISLPLVYLSIQQLGETMGTSLNYATPLLAQASWIFAFIFNLESISRLRGQGNTVVTDSSLPKGKQVSTRPNAPMVFLSTMGMDFILNMILLPAIFGFENSLGIYAWKAFENAALNSAAKTPFEIILTGKIKKGETLVDAGKVSEGNKLLKSGYRWEQITSNYFFPALKVLHLLAPATLAAASGYGETLLYSTGTYLLPIIAVLSPLLVNQKAIGLIKRGYRNITETLFNQKGGSGSRCQLIFAQ